MSKTSLIIPVVSTQYRLVMDGWTDRQTERHTTTAHTALALRRAVKKTHLPLRGKEQECYDKPADGRAMCLGDELYIKSTSFGIASGRCGTSTAQHCHHCSSAHPARINMPLRLQRQRRDVTTPLEMRHFQTPVASTHH